MSPDPSAIYATTAPRFVSAWGALEFVLASFMGYLATSTLILMVGMTWSLPFRPVAWLIFAMAVTLALISAVRVALALARLDRRHMRVAAAVATLLALAGGLAASIDRPDADDVVYVPKSVYYTEHPDALIDRSVPWIATPDTTLTQPVVTYYELAQAAFAIVLGVPYLDLYHIAFPALVGVLMGLAALLLVRVFVGHPSALLVALFFLLLLSLATGETHRTYGNLTLARAFHAKYMLVAVGLPAWTYFSLRYFQDGGRYWIALLVTATGMAGATTTAFVTLPFLSIALLIAFLAGTGRPLFARAGVMLGARYLASLAVLLAMGAAFRQYAVQRLAYGSATNSTFPPDFWGQLAQLVNPDMPVMPVAFGASLAVLFLNAGYARFFGAWIAVLVLLLLNPLVAEPVMRHVTSENIYWRLFYLLPFPLAACIAFAALFERKPTLACVLLGSLAVAALASPSTVLRSTNGARLGLPGHKIGPGESIAAAVVAGVSPGTMLAPLDISSGVVLLSSAYPQFHTREDWLRFIMDDAGRADLFQQRTRAYRFLYHNDRSSAAQQAFASIVDADTAPNHVVVLLAADNAAAVLPVLHGTGYVPGILLRPGTQVFNRKS